MVRIITPSAWNLSPRDSAGLRVPLEEALLGTPVTDTDNLVEVGRVVRSFDPCIFCTVHILNKKNASYDENREVFFLSDRKLYQPSKAFFPRRWELLRGISPSSCGVFRVRRPAEGAPSPSG
ncbi:MAG: nickel-dependent hydrogenase large subunit [Dethiobacter sp.]